MEIINQLDQITIREIILTYDDLVTAFFIGYFVHMFLNHFKGKT